MNHRATFILIALFSVVLPMIAADNGRPEGWATCKSVYTAGDYDLTGGADGSLIVLRSNGADMREAIAEAVITHDVIVFDGIDGDFELSSLISFQSITGKTLIGVNGAKLYTSFTVSKEICDMLDELNVKSLSQNAGDNLGGTLSNGAYVAEQCELTIRQAIIDRYGDEKERYRYSGVFDMVGCSNIIIRNLDFEGPGSLDVGGADLLTLNGCNHIWVDHCRFTDGMDGNLDIVNNSDFVTVSDTHFRYTEKAYNHPLSNLNSGTEITDGSPQKNNISWIRCFWDEGCLGRMPLTGLGIHHILNCYWDCPQGSCINAHKASRLLIESSYFTSRVKRALVINDDDVKYEWRNCNWVGHVLTSGNAKVEVPYEYTVTDVKSVPEMMKNVGPTLADPYSRALSSAPAELNFGKVYSGNQVSGLFNISAFGATTPSVITFSAPDGVTLSLSADGEFTSDLAVKATDANLIQADVYVKAAFSKSGKVEMSIIATTPDNTFHIPVKAEVIGLSGVPSEAVVFWPFDKGVSNDTDAETSPAGVFTTASFSLGEKIAVNSSKKISGEIFTLFNPTEDLTKVADDDCCITFEVVPAEGYVFVPKKLSLNAARMGTDMCYIDIQCSRDAGEPQNLLTGFQPVRSSDSPYYSTIELPLNNVGVGETLRIKLNLYYLLTTKQLALRNIKIEGDVYVADESAVESIATDEIAGEAEYFDLTGRRISHPRSGNIYLLRQSNHTKAKAVLIK
ncbi:MAG: hypothetical protein HDS51_03330 [Barnesiella sp.]|nr:hypothetical protein [Barnesiella sp.]